MKHIKGGIPKIVTMVSIFLGFGILEAKTSNSENPGSIASGDTNTIMSGFSFDLPSDITESFPSTGNVRFYVHKVGDYQSNHLAYSFYIITDPHIGGIDANPDYNITGYSPDLNLWLLEPQLGMSGDTCGGYPGRHLDAAINLINNNYSTNLGEGMDQGEAVFCMVLGDQAITAERAELQHAKRKLNHLKMPWVSVVGNHDTWPWVNASLSWSSDWYYEQVFGSPLISLGKRADIFPNWVKQAVDHDSNRTLATRPQSWAFDMGPNHHVGLDFAMRTPGGIDIFGTLATGSWNWYKTHRQNKTSFHERIIVSAHHPLDLASFPYPANDGALQIVDFFNSYDPNSRSYWFSGHEHPQPDKYWLAGTAENRDLVEVHVSGNTDRGDENNPFYVGLVKVYSDYVCDFAIANNPTVKNEPVTLASTSHFYSGTTINQYHWDFGDGTGTFNTTSNSISHTYTKYGEFWIKHWVENSQGKRSYMIRKIGVGEYLHPPDLWVEIKSTASQPPLLGRMAYLVPGGGGGGLGDYIGYFHWYFNPGGVQYTWDDFSHYEGYRISPQNKHCFTEYGKVEYGVADQWPDWGLYNNNTYTWRLYAYLNANDHYPATNVYDDYTKTIGTPPGGGCPDLSVYFKDDTISGYPIRRYLENNTILPHSEHYQESRTDLLKIEGLKADADHYYLNVTETDTKTSYIDYAKLWVIDHPGGTGVATSSGGDIFVYSDIIAPTSCEDDNRVDRYEEILSEDDSAFIGPNSSYLTVTFPDVDWPNKGLLICTGISDITPAGNNKNYMCIPNKSDGNGGWTPMDEAFARKNPSFWITDVSNVDDNTFRIDCVGDSSVVNSVSLVKLEITGWNKDSAQIDSAVRWYQPRPGEWASDIAGAVLLRDGIYFTLSPSMQLALRFDTLSSDTSIIRDFVLETHGYYNASSIGGGQSGGEVIPFSLEIQPLQPLSRISDIQYSVPQKTNVKIVVYDVQGRLVSKLIDNEVQPGYHKVSWKGSDGLGKQVGAGVYFIRMTCAQKGKADFDISKKVILIK